MAQQTSDLAPIYKFVAQNLPVIPITTASEWFEDNSQNWVGWPTQQNPYETGQPTGTNTGAGAGTDEVMILHLSRRARIVCTVGAQIRLLLRPSGTHVAELGAVATPAQS